MRTREIIALVSGSAVLALILLSFPNSYHSSEGRLADLVASSDLVVLADVTGVTGAPAPSEPAPPAAGIPLVARLEVRQVWKGEAIGSVDVSFEECLSWPAPPRYVNGSRVIAFLRRSEGGWATIQVAAVANGPGAEEDLDPATATADSGWVEAGWHAACLPGLSTMAPAAPAQPAVGLVVRQDPAAGRHAPLRWGQP